MPLHAKHRDTWLFHCFPWIITALLANCIMTIINIFPVLLVPIPQTCCLEPISWDCLHSDYHVDGEKENYMVSPAPCLTGIIFRNMFAWSTQLRFSLRYLVVFRLFYVHRSSHCIVQIFTSRRLTVRSSANLSEVFWLSLVSFYK